MRTIAEVVNECWNPEFSIIEKSGCAVVTWFKPYTPEIICEMVDAITENTDNDADAATKKVEDGMNAIFTELGTDLDEFKKRYEFCIIGEETIYAANEDLREIIAKYDASHEISLKDFFIVAIGG